VVNHWQVTGFGYHTDAEREIAHAIAQRLQQGRSGSRPSAPSEEAA